MAKENANWITELVDSNPLPTDPVSEGNDHLQMIKTVLKNTFPGTSTSPLIPDQAGKNNKVLASDGTNTRWTSALNVEGTFSDATFNRYAETTKNLGAVSGATVINLDEDPNVIIMQNASICSLIISTSRPLDSGQFIQLTLLVNGGGVMDWPSGTQWANGVAPTPSSGWDVYTLVKFGTQTPWLGFSSVSFS